MRIKPFQAWRPPPELAPRVASLPYDVVDSEQAAALADGNDMSFLHVVRSEIDLPPGADPYDSSVYERAARNFRIFQDRAYIRQDPEPALYVYRLTMGAHEQTGIVCVSHVQDYERDLIKKHEKTRRRTEDDRTRHISIVNAHAGPVFLTYRDVEDIDGLVGRLCEAAPACDFTAADGIRHTIWSVGDSDELVSAFAAVPVAYVADGHHRAASAVRVARMRRDGNPAHAGDEEYNWFMTVFFPASQLNILPYNRCIADLDKWDRDAYLTAVRDVFDVETHAAPSPAHTASVSMYLDGVWYALGWSPEPSADPVDALDVSVLQDRLLSPILGIDDPRENPRITFVGGNCGTEELQGRVDAAQAAVAFSMYPTSIEQLMAIADAGQIMPPKSTWFEPKLRSGLIVHTMD